MDNDPAQESFLYRGTTGFRIPGLSSHHTRTKYTIILNQLHQYVLGELPGTLAELLLLYRVAVTKTQIASKTRIDAPFQCVTSARRHVHKYQQTEKYVPNSLSLYHQHQCVSKTI